MSLSKALNNWHKRRKIKCKSPKEIDIQYRGYKTRLKNLGEYEKLRDKEGMPHFGKEAMKIHDQIRVLIIKIKLMENILKLDK